MRPNRCRDVPGQLVIVALLLGVLLSMFPFSAALAASKEATASTGGRITGRLLDGSNKNAPLVGQSVTLQMAQDTSGRDLATVKTDAQGAYIFNNLATDKAINYAVYINYQGAQYISDVVTLDSKPTQQINLTVYAATLDTSKIAIVRATVLIQKPDAQKGTFQVSEILAFKNLDSRTFVGSLDTSNGKPKALFFTLPTGARNVSLTKGFDGYKSMQVGNGFASNAAVLPGDNEFSFSFEVPYTASTYDFRYEIMYPTVVLMMMVPPDIYASSGVLTSQGTTTANQQPYQLLQTTKLLQNQQVRLRLEGLPTPTSAGAPSPLDTRTIWILAGALLMLAVIVVSGYLYRVTQRQTEKQQKRGKETRGKSQSKMSKQRSGAVKTGREMSVSDRQEELLAELLALDKAFEAGKLTKAAYQEKRAKTKARLRTVMSERETARK